MAATPAPDGPAAGKVIVNPLSGERISIRPGTPADGVLVWELLLAPGGRVPSSHSHPGQEECFTVLAGTMRFRVGRRRLVARPGEVVRVPPGTVHHFANPSSVPARVAVTTRPALSMAALLETAAVLAGEQQAAGRRLPRLLDLLLFMRDFDREVQAPLLPRLVRLATRGAARLAARTGRDQRYRRLRAGAAPPGGRDEPPGLLSLTQELGDRIREYPRLGDVAGEVSSALREQPGADAVWVFLAGNGRLSPPVAGHRSPLLPDNYSG